MTDNEIIKALEHCMDCDCIGCPNNIRDNCDGVESEVLDLINRQKAEIERLLQKLQQPQSEAIKEFAERLKDRYPYEDSIYLETTYEMFYSEIDEIVKEMVGEDK